MSAREMAAAITTAASAVCGRSASRELKKSSRSATTDAPTSPVSWLLAPDCSATAVREPLVDTAKPWKNPGGQVGGPDADHLLVRVDLVATASREARRRRDRVGQRDQRDADRRRQQRTDIAEVGPGQRRPRQPLREGPHRVDSQVEDGSHHRRTDHGDEDSRNRPCEAGQHEQNGQRDHAEDQRRRVALVESAAGTPARSSTKPSASVENPHSLGSWPTMMVIASPFMYPTWTSFESRSATKPSFAIPSPIRISPTMIAIIPASATAVSGSPATASGSDGGEDQR